MSINESDRSETYKVNLNLDNNNDARVIGYSFIEPNTKVLDVGCACGDFGKLIKTNKNCEVYGLEFDLNSIKIAESTNCYKNIYQADLNNFDLTDFEQYYSQFDYIILLDVLEHLLDPQKVLDQLKRFLKPEGKFIISLPNVSHCSIVVNLLCDNFEYTDTGIMDRTHVKFFTYKSIAAMLTEQSLKIVGSNVVLSDNLFLSKDQRKSLLFFSKWLIQRNFHSYVYQYVTMSGLTNINHEILGKDNIKQFKIGWLTLKKWLIKTKLGRLKAFIFPPNTWQNKLAKKAKYLISVRKQ